MSTLSTLRAGLAAALTDNTLYTVFSFPPTMPIANSIVISPGDPYITPSNNSYNTIAPLANFQVSIIVPLLDNEGNLIGIEDDILRVFNLLAASSYTYNVSDVSAPAILNAVSGDLLTCSINISILTSWS